MPPIAFLWRSLRALNKFVTDTDTDILICALQMHSAPTPQPDLWPFEPTVSRTATVPSFKPFRSLLGFRFIVLDQIPIHIHTHTYVHTYTHTHIHHAFIAVSAPPYYVVGDRLEVIIVYYLFYKKKSSQNQTRICTAEMAVRYAALSACRKVHPWR